MRAMALRLSACVAPKASRGSSRDLVGHLCKKSGMRRSFRNFRSGEPRYRSVVEISWISVGGCDFEGSYNRCSGYSTTRA
jgi:hypothetical protein